MSCNVDWSIRERYPTSVEVLFITCSGDPVSDMNEELDKLGTATDYPTVRELRPISNLEMVQNAGEAFLEKLQFTAIDVTNPNSLLQDADTIAAIIASKTSSKAYAQSQYKNGAMPVNFQPNFCHPVLTIDGKVTIPALNTAPGYPELGIGISVPTCLDINLPLGKVQDISFISAFAQFIAETAKYQNYPLIVQATFWVGTGGALSNCNQ